MPVFLLVWWGCCRNKFFLQTFAKFLKLDKTSSNIFFVWQEEASASGMASELNLSNVGGVFVVLIGGMGLALVVAVFEFLGECRNIAKEDEVSDPKQISNSKPNYG